MRPPPKHPSCDPSLVLKADRQAKGEGSGWNTCDQCDTQGLWWRQSKTDPMKWMSAVCTDCEGYGWTYLVESTAPHRQSVRMMASRFDGQVRSSGLASGEGTPGSPAD